MSFGLVWLGVKAHLVRDHTVEEMASNGPVLTDKSSARRFDYSGSMLGFAGSGEAFRPHPQCKMARPVVTRWSLKGTLNSPLGASSGLGASSKVIMSYGDREMTLL